MSSETVTTLENDQLKIVTSFPDNPAWNDQIETVDAYGTFHTIDMMKRANQAGGFHFFSRDAMRFFRSRIAPGVTHGRVFITSEQTLPEAPPVETESTWRPTFRSLFDPETS